MPGAGTLAGRSEGVAPRFRLSADGPSGRSHDRGVVGDVVDDHGVCADGCAGANAHVAENPGSRPDAREGSDRRARDVAPAKPEVTNGLTTTPEWISTNPSITTWPWAR